MHRQYIPGCSVGCLGSCDTIDSGARGDVQILQMLQISNSKNKSKMGPESSCLLQNTTFSDHLVSVMQITQNRFSKKLVMR